MTKPTPRPLGPIPLDVWAYQLYRTVAARQGQGGQALPRFQLLKPAQRRQLLRQVAPAVGQWLAQAPAPWVGKVLRGMVTAGGELRLQPPAYVPAADLEQLADLVAQHTAIGVGETVGPPTPPAGYLVRGRPVRCRTCSARVWVARPATAELQVMAEHGTRFLDDAGDIHRHD